jgi:hypothetical protein
MSLHQAGLTKQPGGFIRTAMLRRQNNRMTADKQKSLSSDHLLCRRARKFYEA